MDHKVFFNYVLEEDRNFKYVIPGILSSWVVPNKMTTRGQGQEVLNTLYTTLDKNNEVMKLSKGPLFTPVLDLL